MTTFPLTTTLQRVHANCMPVPCRLDNALRKLENSPTHDTPISYAQILDTLGLDYALICCRAEPQHEQLWRSYVAWCFDRANARGCTLQITTDIENINLAASAMAAKSASKAKEAAFQWLSTEEKNALQDAVCDEMEAVEDVAAAKAWDAVWYAERQAQADAFRQLVTTGTLP